jgi:hypothetical protein
MRGFSFLLAAVSVVFTLWFATEAGVDPIPRLAEPVPYAKLAKVWAETLRLEPEAIYCTPNGDCSLRVLSGELYALDCDLAGCVVWDVLGLPAQVHVGVQLKIAARVVATHFEKMLSLRVGLPWTGMAITVEDARRIGDDLREHGIG